jgi:transposase
MLLPFNTTIWFYRQPIDFRKQIDGIVILVADTLQKDPVSGQLFVFRNKKADKLKMLYWENQGFWLLYKRFEKGIAFEVEHREKALFFTSTMLQNTNPLSMIGLRVLVASCIVMVTRFLIYYLNLRR